MLFVALLMPVQSQVTPVEQQRSATNQAPSTNIVIQEERLLIPEELEVAVEAAAMGVLDEAGYFAVFSAIRREALAANRHVIPPLKQQQLDMVVEKMEQLYPQSFGYHYASWLNARLDTAMGGHLLEAFRLAPQRSEIYDDLVALAELSADTAMKAEFCRLIDTGKVYDPLLYQYARNLFRSVDQGAYIFTQGEWDTYPIWVLQNVHGERADITVLQLDLLQQKHYFDRVMAPFRLKRNAWQRFTSDRVQFFRELAATKHGKPVYVALTIDPQIINANSDKLYTTGLAMKLSDKPLENIPILARNWKTFDLSALDASTGNSDLNRMNGNYIMPMGLLYVKAVEEGNNTEAEQLRQKMLEAAAKAGRRSEMEKFF